MEDSAMNFETIGTQTDKKPAEACLNAIEAQLTGVAANDFPLLVQNLALANSICSNPNDLRAALSGYVLSYSPNTTPEACLGLIRFDAHDAQSQMSRAKAAADAGDFNIAMSAMTALMAKIEKLFRRFPKSTIFNFNNDFEAFVYRRANFNAETTYCAPFNLAQAYNFFGKLHLHANDIDRAITYFRRALDWNPVSPAYYLDLAAAYFTKREFKLHEINTSLAYRYLLTAEHYKRFYFEEARRFDNDSDHKFAAELYKLCLAFGDHARARGGLEYIEKFWFKCATPPLSRAHLSQSCADHHLEFGPSSEMQKDITAFTGEAPHSPTLPIIQTENQASLAKWNSII